MKKSGLVLMFALFSCGEPSAAATLDEKLDEFRQFLQEYRRDEQIPSFSVAQVKDGEIVLSEAVGWQDHDAEEPTTTDDRSWAERSCGPNRFVLRP